MQANFSKTKYGIRYNSVYDSKYSAAGKFALVDGVYGSTNFSDGRWQGFNGSNLDVTVDLGKVETIHNISTSFLSDINSFIFLPKLVEYLISSNGIDFKSLQVIDNDDLTNRDAPPFIKPFDYTYPHVKISARYIRVKAINIGVCPPWHKGAGEKAWLFCDEISVK